MSRGLWTTVSSGASILLLTLAWCAAAIAQNQSQYQSQHERPTPQASDLDRENMSFSPAVRF